MLFDSKCTQTLQNKNLTIPHHILLQKYKKSQIQVQSVLDLG